LRIRERELTQHVFKYYRNKGYYVFTEQFAGMGRADIVAIRSDPSEVNKRLKHRIKGLPLRTIIRLLSALDKEVLSIKELASALNFSESYIKKVINMINPLYIEKIVTKDKIVKVRKIADYKPFTKEVITVEVKVDDWRSGLFQADMYTYASHKSYLAISMRGFRKIPKPVLEWCKKKGIGVLVIDEKGSVNEVISARKIGPKSLLSYYRLTESLWNNMFGNYLK